MEKTRKVQRVLFINPPGKIYIFPDGSPAHRKHCTPPLGIAYIAATTRDAGYTPDVIDILAEGYSHEELRDPFLIYGLPWEKTRQRVLDFAPDIIGISVLFSSAISEALDIAKRIKEMLPDVPIVFGGQHPTGAANDVMSNEFVDYVMLGEADYSFVKLLDSLNGMLPLADVPALVYRQDGQIRSTMENVKPAVQGDGWAYYNRKDAGIPLDLDALPLPAWDLFDFSHYWNADVRYGGGDVARNRFVVMASTRGCPHACTFCTSPLNSGYKAYRKRGIEEIISEIRWLVDDYGVQEIHFVDDNFNVGKAHAKKLMTRIAEEFPGVLFSATGGTEVNSVDEDVATLMANAGFYKVQLAIEAGDQEVQNDHVDKKVNISRVPYVIELLKSRGIDVRGLFMIGFPGETREQIQRTLTLAQSLDLDDFYISLVTPLPGTPLYDECVERGLFTEGLNVNDIRYSFASIKLPNVTSSELTTMRREVWREAFETRRNRVAKNSTDKRFREFDDYQSYERAGFKSLQNRPDIKETVSSD